MINSSLLKSTSPTTLPNSFPFLSINMLVGKPLILKVFTNLKPGSNDIVLTVDFDNHIIKIHNFLNYDTNTKQIWNKYEIITK